MSIFEKASKGKYRYNYYGSITTEDLWTLSNEGLTAIYRDLVEELQSSQSDELFDKPTKATDELETKIAIIEHIAKSRIAEKEKALKAKENAELRQKILRVKQKKADEELEGKTLEELDEMLKEID